MGQKKYYPNRRLKEARELRGWSQDQLTEKLGLADKTTVSRWERGIAVPHPSSRHKLVKLFKVSIQQLGFFQEGEEDASKLLRLPHPATPLLGRDLELEEIQNLLRQRCVQLLTLFGTGGVGKTRVGIEVAAHMSQYFSDGLCFVPLATVSDPAL